MGNFCLQSTDQGVFGNEDCLNLNIMRPATLNDEPLPILFFTHGGSFTNGAGNEETYINNPQLAKNAILVTHNYRLQALGFLAHPELSKEDADLYSGSGTSGNQGLFDTLLALQWVNDNAEAIGGSTDSIMIFGESAGGESTCALLTSPIAADLFTSALIQSAGCLWFPELKTSTLYSQPAEEIGTQFIQEVGCEIDDLDCLRSKDAEEIIEAMPDDNYSPNVDGIFLTTHPTLSLAYGNFNRVPIAAGVTGNEGSMFIHDLGLETETELVENLNDWSQYFGITDTETLHSLYTIEEHGTAQEAFDQFYSDLLFVCPTRFLLESVSPYVATYGYHYTHVPSWIEYYPFMEGWGSYHSSELPFVFGSYLDTLTVEENALSAEMQQSWIGFANQQPTVGNAEWTQYSTQLSEGGAWAHFGSTSIEMTSGVNKSKCDFISIQWFGQ